MYKYQIQFNDKNLKKEIVPVFILLSLFFRYWSDGGVLQNVAAEFRLGVIRDSTTTATTRIKTSV